jgi:hypothetical protein
MGGWVCPQQTFLHFLATAAVSSAAAGSEMAMSTFWAGALRDLRIALVQGNQAVHREGVNVYATAGGTVATHGVVVGAVDVK